MSRRKHGAGTKETLPSGRVRVRMRAGGKRIDQVFDTDEEAEEFRNASLVLMAEGTLTPGSALTLRTWGRRWLDRREVSGLRSIAGDRSRWQHHVCGAAFVDWPLGAVTRKAIRDWLHDPTRRALSPASRRLLRAMISKCFADAMEEDLIAANPATGISLPAETREEEPWTFLAMEEIEQLLGAEAVPREARLLYQMAIYSGLRQGELWCLRWSDVNLKTGELNVRRGHKGPTKSGKPRAIPLLPRAREALETWRPLCPEMDQDLVWPSPTGLRRRAGDDGRWFDYQIRGKMYPGHRSLAGLRPDVRFHDLRHTCASHLIMGTWGPPWALAEVRDYLGHSSVKVTERYAHLSPDHLRRKAAETIGPRLVHENGPQPRMGDECQSEANMSGFAPLPAGLTHAWTTAAPLAQAIVTLAAAGQPVPDLLLEGLADAVLSAEPVRLARAIKQSGEHRLERALALADLVWGDQAEPVRRKAGGVR